MDRYIYLRVGQRRWHRMLFGFKRSMPIAPGMIRLDEADAAHLFEWCKNHVKGISAEDRRAGTNAPGEFSCSLTKHECEGIFEECEKLLEQCGHAGTPQPSETAERRCWELRMLTDGLKRCVNDINWRTSVCVILVKNSACIID